MFDEVKIKPLTLWEKIRLAFIPATKSIDITSEMSHELSIKFLDGKLYVLNERTIRRQPKKVAQ